MSCGTEGATKTKSALVAVCIEGGEESAHSAVELGEDRERKENRGWEKRFSSTTAAAATKRKNLAVVGVCFFGTEISRLAILPSLSLLTCPLACPRPFLLLGLRDPGAGDRLPRRRRSPVEVSAAAEATRTMRRPATTGVARAAVVDGDESAEPRLAETDVSCFFGLM